MLLCQAGSGVICPFAYVLHSAIQCIRRARSSEGHYIKSDPIDLIQYLRVFIDFRSLTASMMDFVNLLRLNIN